MAKLTDEERAAGRAEFGRQISMDFEEIGATKDELVQIYNALDDWLDANAGAANQAIPAALRNKLSQKQKARMMSDIIQRRYRTGA